MKKLLLIIAAVFTLAACTENSRVKNFGGSGKITLDKGLKLEMITWKDNELWVLTSDRPDSVMPKSYKFTEKSSWGVIEGIYLIDEQ